MSLSSTTKISSLWDYSSTERRGIDLPECDVPSVDIPVEFQRKTSANLPEVSELDIVRHYTRLSQLNFSIDTEFYPLGSCTMKYNPRINEKVAGLDGFAQTHPLQDDADVQGNLELIYKLQSSLAELGGFTAASVQPSAGAQGELAGVLMIKQYHLQNEGDDGKRTKILIPDSAHGTNPATVSMAGYQVVEIPSDERGNMDIVKLKEACDDTIAGLMITNPNTLGLFEENIEEVVALVHGCGGLIYGDGANMNAIMGIVKPADLGIDVMHYNLHKTFSTPHGGGGPGAGPVVVNEKLQDFLPGPIVVKEGARYKRMMPSKSIGRLRNYDGNFGVLVRAYTYLVAMGRDGLTHVAEMAVLNANYLRVLVKDSLPTWYDRSCMHEFVSSGAKIAKDIQTLDIAKRLIDYGFHPPTIYFPLIVPQAIMIEPTETESKETIESFAKALNNIVKEAQETPALLHNAPHEKSVSRLDEVKAVKEPVLKRTE